MQLSTIANTANQTMTSIELLEIVNEERTKNGETAVRHNDFLSRCRDELDDTNYETFVIAPPERGGRPITAIRMTQDQCKLVAMRESKSVRRHVLARLKELEAKQQQNLLVLPNFTDPAEAAIAWATEYKAKQLALKQLEVAKPKVEFVDTFVDRGSNRNITSVAKELGITAIALGKWLRAKGYMNKSTKKQEWNKEFIDKGYGVQKLFNTEVKEDTFKSGSQVLVTPAGDLFIKEQVKKHGLVVDFGKQE